MINWNYNWSKIDPYPIATTEAKLILYINKIDILLTIESLLRTENH